MKQANNIPVIMYHHVTKHGGKLSVSLKSFESQMRGLAQNGYKTITANQFSDFMQGKITLPEKSVLLTFDDGFLDNWVYAHPVLKRYGLNAVLFAITGLIGNGEIRPHIDMDNLNSPVPDCSHHEKAKEIMFGDNPDSVMLRWSEIKAMEKEGTFEIHCHTSTHHRWDLSTDANEIIDNGYSEYSDKINDLGLVFNNKNNGFYQDLRNAKQHLIDNLGNVSKHFCWPQGYFDADYQKIASSLGFDVLYTTDARGQNKVNGDLSHVYRFAIRNKSFWWLRRRLWLSTHTTLAPIYNKWRAAKDAKKRAKHSAKQNNVR